MLHYSDDDYSDDDDSDDDYSDDYSDDGHGAPIVGQKRARKEVDALEALSSEENSAAAEGALTVIIRSSYRGDEKLFVDAEDDVWVAIHSTVYGAPRIVDVQFGGESISHGDTFRYHDVQDGAILSVIISPPVEIEASDRREYESNCTQERERAGVDGDSLEFVLIIPDRVAAIEEDAFALCSSLTSVVIPDDVTAIEEYAFYECSSLTSVTIPSSVATIGCSAFSGCSSLPSVVIPDDVTAIEQYAFSGCSSLASVTIPDNVTMPSGAAFPSTCEVWVALNRN